MLSLAEQESSCTQEPLDFEELSKIFDEAFKLQEEEDRLKAEEEQKQKEWKTFTRTFEYEKAEETGFYKITKVKRKEIKNVTIPRFVSVIARKAFSSCSSLTNITIPDSVKVIGDHAFSECVNLINIKISNSVISIGTYAFIGCSHLEKIIVEEGNEVYHSAQNCLIETKSKTLILGCKNSIIPTDGSLTSIGHGAFCRCLDLTSITIPNSVTSIEDGAFCNCWSLQSINIPDGVTIIGEHAFYGCSLQSIIIPNSVTSIGKGAFQYCKKLVEIYYDAAECEDLAYDHCLFDNAGIDSKNGITVFIGANVKKIPSYLFDSFSSSCIIANVKFEDESVCKSIGRYAFQWSLGQQSIAIPHGVTSIEDGAFAHCWGLQRISLPSSVISIGKFAFSDCRFLTAITIPNSVTSIGNYAFSNCPNLTSITIPDSVRLIGHYAFEGCDSLSTVVFTGKKSQWKKLVSNIDHLSTTSVPAKYVICSNKKVKL